MTLIIIIIITVVLYLIFKSDSSNTSSRATKSISPRLNVVEHLSEEEFISFVRNNYGYYDKYFTNEGIGGNRMLSKWWSTSKYIIRSDYDDDNLNDFITVIRKSDNKEIFSGCWGHPDEDDYDEY